MREISEVQCRTARALLDWSQAELAKQSNLSESTIRDFEKRRRVPSANNLAAISAAFSRAGVIFLDDGDRSQAGGEGVRFADDSSGKKTEREIAEVEREITSARALHDWLVEQMGVNDQMRNNANFGNLFSQSRSELSMLEHRLMLLKFKLGSDADLIERAVKMQGEEQRNFENLMRAKEKKPDPA